MEPEGSLLCSQETSTVPILSQISPIHTTPSHLPKPHFNINLLSTFRSSECSLSFWLSDKNCNAFLLFPMRAIFPAHLILLQLILIITSYGATQYEDPLQPPTTSSLFRPNIPLSTLFSNTLNLCSSHNWGMKNIPFKNYNVYQNVHHSSYLDIREIRHCLCSSRFHCMKDIATFKYLYVHQNLFGQAADSLR
jgi:hypothetical protein